MNKIHIILQGKGGVGKSFAASLLVQYYREREKPVIAVDTDPVNATLSNYTALGVDHLELMENGEINARKFDSLIERVITEDSNFVIDNGASSFIPLSSYLKENDALKLIADHKKEVVIHTVVTGGQAMRDTLTGFKALAEQLSAEARLIVWLNEFFGEIKTEVKGEMLDFENMKVYLENRERVSSIVRISRQTGSTFGQDIQHMLDRNMTFEEVAQSQDIGLMAKSRLAQVKKAIFDQLISVI